MSAVIETCSDCYELGVVRNSDSPKLVHLCSVHGDQRVVAEVERRMVAVVDAAVEWHQSGQEGDDTWLDKGEVLGQAIDSLLELREKPMKHQRCPTCDSPQPQLHPSVQLEGECSICPDPFHGGVLDAVGRPVSEIGSWQCQRCHLTAMTTWRGTPNPDDAPACCGGELMLPYRIQTPEVVS